MLLRTAKLRESLELINVHKNANRFHIFPVVGPEKVVCHFSNSLMSQAVSAVGRSVRVLGKTRKKPIDRFPHAIEVESIEVLP